MCKSYSVKYKYDFIKFSIVFLRCGFRKSLLEWFSGFIYGGVRILGLENSLDKGYLMCKWKI